MVTLCPALLVGDQLMFLQTVSVLYIWGHHTYMVTMEDMCILLWVSVYCSWWQYTVTIESGCVCVCVHWQYMVTIHPCLLLLPPL